MVDDATIEQLPEFFVQRLLTLWYRTVFDERLDYVLVRCISGGDDHTGETYCITDVEGADIGFGNGSCQLKSWHWFDPAYVIHS
jgi:hypothetical protein